MPTTPTTGSHFLTLSFLNGILLILRAIVLQHRLGGNWREMPWRFPPAAKYVYFAGSAVVILGSLLAKVWM